MRERLLVAAAAALTFGCASTPSIPPLPTEVKVPVAVACIDAVPPPPALTAEKVYADTQDEWQRARALKVDRLRLIEYQNTLRAIALACVRKDAP